MVLCANNSLLGQRPDFIDSSGLHGVAPKKDIQAERFNEYTALGPYWEGVRKMQMMLDGMGMGMKVEPMFMGDGMMVLGMRKGEPEYA